MAFKIVTNPDACSAQEREAKLIDPGFGKVFTDHMATIKWTSEAGWHDAKIEPRRPFLIDPAASVFHYAQEIFEGMKAYRADDGRIVLFRPERNAQRFNMSAERMAMPQISESMFLEAIETLVKTEQAWIPTGEGSLYLRPFMIASEPFLGVRPSNEYIFCVIASPAGSYFKGGRKAVNIWVSPNYSRAASGGTGFAKCGGNYAASLAAQKQAQQHDCQQVVFLDAAEHKWVEELGGMNIFFVFEDGSIITPPLSGTILPGITRESLMQLARDAGHVVEERLYSIDEWQADAKSGRLREVFACGTAAVITAIGEVRSESVNFVTSPESKVTDRLYAQLTGIQKCTLNDPHSWVKVVD